jgi:hypothetical protein
MLDEARELTLIRSVLVETFPEECRRVGNANLNDIVKRRGQVRIVPITGASRLDWVAALTLLANSAIILSCGLSITKNALNSNNDSKAGPLIQIDQTNHVQQVSQISRNEDGGQIILFNEIKLSLPPELLDRLEPAVIDKLIAALVAHLLAQHDRGSN